ncbi:hypothetical protein [Sphingobacterium detergens]|uniref:Uncharacterized protein n=1 Tax=Sphingobacterium detergens TaxID=1145106 RepID=A0A420ARR0_SPHD1|nr:hypothetical protein [Sphingobacterium detergens]RKE47156.1 hypothetical protein DFQ12_4318 [Sphingobacterium detergens]
MEQVTFTPTGIALKQHELYGLDDALLLEQVTHLRNDIVGWSQQNFILDDRQLDWLVQQDGSFRGQFAKQIADGLIGRFDFNIMFIGPPQSWKSKRIAARENLPVKAIDIRVEYIP